MAWGCRTTGSILRHTEPWSALLGTCARGRLPHSTQLSSRLPGRLHPHLHIYSKVPTMRGADTQLASLIFNDPPLTPIQSHCALALSMQRRWAVYVSITCSEYDGSLMEDCTPRGSPSPLYLNPVNCVVPPSEGFLSHISLSGLNCIPCLAILLLSWSHKTLPSGGRHPVLPALWGGKGCLATGLPRQWGSQVHFDMRY